VRPHDIAWLTLSTGRGKQTYWPTPTPRIVAKFHCRLYMKSSGQWPLAPSTYMRACLYCM
jgi:hypothetical protein